MSINFSEEITFVIFTFNEEDRVERVVKNFIKYGKVLIVDNYSVDRTREIALQLGSEILLHKNLGWVDDEFTALAVKDAVTTPWIYWGYADEMVSPGTLVEIQEKIKDSALDIISISRKNYYYGAYCFDAHSGYINRVFRKNAIDFIGNKIHNFGVVTVSKDKILRLNSKIYFIHHFISYTAKDHLRVIDRYTDIQVEEFESASLYKIIGNILKIFLSNYIGKRGYKAGKAGFYLCMEQIFYHLNLYMKSDEKNLFSNATIEQINNNQKDIILSNIK
ncbi:glycosyltransferase [Polynucleobacter sp. UK-Gri1-W3]|uniref:glycosyltransferase n=1 Tax=Polynucleobacter sp. UK-Gri1-W3 TaxID=1819737 RepID=UPI001C0C7068|nr:glycosyltransferase [Polynucleobacter sp. UK-Gri1-W3]MBU3538247.1 glycosyltransferase [Polynucleobacter sp. UK-Gri1-W3]